MKSKDVPVAEYDGAVDWGDWANEDRNVAQLGALSSEQIEQVQSIGESEGRVGPLDDDANLLDTTIAGPWMNRWSPIIHHNRHTANMDPDGALHGWGGGFYKEQEK